MTSICLPDAGATWPTTAPESAGLEATALAAATEFAQGRNSTAFLVAHDGALVCEHYWQCEQGFDDAPMLSPTFLADGRSREDVASAQKSVVSVLVGIAIGKGLLRLDDGVSAHVGAGWSRAPVAQESAIMVRHLLSMTSGLDVTARYAATPGSTWAYNLGSTWHTLKAVLCAVAQLPLNELLAQWLTGPLGMAQSEFVDRPTAVPEQAREFALYPDGRAIEGFVSTAQDLTRFGVAVANDGCLANVDLGVAGGYLRQSLSPSSQFNPSYGLLWWLNGQTFSVSPQGQRVEGPMLPAAPADTVCALGALGRSVYIIPSRGLVIVRMGGGPGENVLAASRFGRELFELLQLQALEERSNDGVRNPDYWPDCQTLRREFPYRHSLDRKRSH